MNGSNGIQPTVELATTNGAYPYPVMYGNNGGFGNGAFGSDALWIIVLLALFGWGGNGNGNGFGGRNFDDGYAWLSNGQKEIMQNTNNGFDTLHLSNQLEGNRDAINDLASAVCNGFNSTNTNLLTGFNSLNTSFLNCCCENKLGIADLKYTVATENCQDRQALNEGVRDIIASQVAGTQRVLDKLCQLELDNVKTQVDAKNDRIADLQREISMKDLQASQIAQNSFIAQGFANEVDALYNRLANCPVPSTPVYGRTPIFTCNNGCGCGMSTTSQFI
jgi:hypothetical protein